MSVVVALFCCSIWSAQSLKVHKTTSTRCRTFTSYLLPRSHLIWRSVFDRLCCGFSAHLPHSYPLCIASDTPPPHRPMAAGIDGVHRYARVLEVAGDDSSNDEDLLSHSAANSRPVEPQPSVRPCHLVLLLVVAAMLATALVSGWSALTLRNPLSLVAPTSSSRNQYGVCTAEGLWLWTLHAGRGWAAAGLNATASLPWSYHSPPPPPSLNSMLWSPAYPHASPPLAESVIADTQNMMCQHMGDLTRDLVYDPLYSNPPNQPSRQHRNIPLPSFPFPSLARRTSPIAAPDSATVPPPPPSVPFRQPSDRVAEGFLADGARVPSNYSSYKYDAPLLSDTWPDCFDNIEHRRDQLTSLHHFLAATASLPPDQLAATLLSSHLNTLGLSLNFDRFPLSDRIHVPIIVTTIDGPRFREELPAMLTSLRSMPGVYETTVYLVFEEVSLETLQLLAGTVHHFRLLLYSVPIQRCIVHRPYESAIGKSWKIDLSMLWSLHVVFNLWNYQYAVILEDDMDPSMDLYAYHLALHQYAVDSPHIMAVAANSYSRYHECYYMGEHLRGRFGVPNITAMHEHQPYLSVAVNSSMTKEPQLAWVQQDDLIAFDYRDTHLLVLERLVVPFACGYTRKFFGYLLNFYLQWPGTLETERYDHITHAVYGSHPNFYTLVPLVPRVHGDRIHYIKARRSIPLMSACQHTEWRIVSPRQHKATITTTDYGFDVITATNDDIDLLKSV